MWARISGTMSKLPSHAQVADANRSGRILEVFGAGTAAVVSPIGGVYYEGEMHRFPTPGKDSSLSQR